jgi:hypothetical protein
MIGPNTTGDGQLTFSVNTARMDPQGNSQCGDMYYSNPVMRAHHIEVMPQGGVDMGPPNLTEFSHVVGLAVSACLRHGWNALSFDDGTLPVPKYGEPLARSALRYA